MSLLSKVSTSPSSSISYRRLNNPATPTTSSRPSKPFSSLSAATCFSSSTALWILALIASLISGIFIGRLSHGNAPVSSGLPDLGHVHVGAETKVFEYNLTYALSSDSVETVEAWTNLTPPVEIAFFPEPSAADGKATLAVFHQLHCLDGLRDAYWHTRALVREGGEPMSEEELDAASGMHAARHVRHCIDYLRQSLMCHADTNIEPVERKFGGVRGFYAEHRCRAYEDAVRWVEARPR